MRKKKIKEGLELIVLVAFASLVICYFIGMTTFFASGLPPETSTGLVLGSGLLAGVLSGLIAVTISGMITRDSAAEAA